MSHTTKEAPLAKAPLEEMSLLGSGDTNSKLPTVDQALPRIGIDIGIQGALALLSRNGDLIDVADMPILRDGPKGRATVNGPLLADIVYRWHATTAFVEHVSARPREGAVGAFAFGRSRGIIEGVMAACGVPVLFITPASWKRAVGLSLASKDAARSEAIRRWPSHAALFARCKDDGRAEACLIAVAGMLRQTPNSQFHGAVKALSQPNSEIPRGDRAE
jgi:crossover junction endodeoxyribonuclease RuvC